MGSWYAYTNHHFLLDPTWPAIGLATAYLVQTILTFYREEKQRAYIHHAFDRYLSANNTLMSRSTPPSSSKLGSSAMRLTSSGDR